MNAYGIKKKREKNVFTKNTKREVLTEVNTNL